MQSRHMRNVVLSAILCTALAPGNVSAGTLRMVIRSHPSLGGKCIDVFNHQIVPGMPVQMWDCNNGPAQIFSYDETSQQLTLGNLCVESLGQGYPRDSVGLRSCDNGVRQHWRVVAAGEYYRFIGVNGLCLDIRSGDKENGAPLQVFPCGNASGTSAAQQLWALLEAPPAATLSAPAAALPPATVSAPAAAPPAATPPTPAAAPQAATPPAPGAAPPAASRSTPGAAQGAGRVMPDDCNQNLNRCSLQIWGRNTFPHTGYTQSVTFANGMVLTCTSNGPNTPRSCTLK